jgi:hypothetical protein
MSELVALGGAFLAGFGACVVMVIAVVRSRDDHEPVPPTDDEW